VQEEYPGILIGFKPSEIMPVGFHEKYFLPEPVYGLSGSIFNLFARFYPD